MREVFLGHRVDIHQVDIHQVLPLFTVSPTMHDDSGHFTNIRDNSGCSIFSLVFGVLRLLKCSHSFWWVLGRTVTLKQG